ncbi:hypothetical protein AAVH_22230 [Aphelenchoides avenae]|nr:hypothetical protein AAVH_22230 [Aphelenchus avenae]
MLAEIAAEVVQFLSRRDLDKACAVSKWLDALISHYCETCPLRRVFEVKLLPLGMYDFMPTVFIDANQNPDIFDSFNSLDEAVHSTGSILRHSYVEDLMWGDHKCGIMKILPDHWKTLVDSIRCGTV